MDSDRQQAGTVTKNGLSGAKSESSVLQERLQAEIQQSQSSAAAAASGGGCGGSMDIVSELFRGFLAKKMDQINKEYHARVDMTITGPSAQKVDEINALLDSQISAAAGAKDISAEAEPALSDHDRKSKKKKKDKKHKKDKDRHKNKSREGDPDKQSKKKDQDYEKHSKDKDGEKHSRHRDRDEKQSSERDRSDDRRSKDKDYKKHTQDKDQDYEKHSRDKDRDYDRRSRDRDRDYDRHSKYGDRDYEKNSKDRDRRSERNSREHHSDRQTSRHSHSHSRSRRSRSHSSESKKGDSYHKDHKEKSSKSSIEKHKLDSSSKSIELKSVDVKTKTDSSIDIGSVTSESNLQITVKNTADDSDSNSSVTDMDRRKFRPPKRKQTGDDDDDSDGLSNVIFPPRPLLLKTQPDKNSSGNHNTKDISPVQLHLDSNKSIKLSIGPKFSVVDSAGINSVQNITLPSIKTEGNIINISNVASQLNTIPLPAPPFQSNLGDTARSVSPFPHPAQLPVSSATSVSGLAEVQSKKPTLKLGLKISQASASFISSGEVIDGKKSKKLEDGEVRSSSENSDSSDDGVDENINDESDEEDDDDEDDDDDGEVSDTPSESATAVDKDKDTESADKKKKKKAKHKKKKKHKEKNKEKRGKRSRSNSRSRSHPRSRSRSRSRSRDHHRHRHQRDDKARSKDRWQRSLDSRVDRYRESKRHRTRSHSRDRHKKRKDSKEDPDLRVRIDKAKLRKIAIANAMSMMQAGQAVPGLNLKSEDLASMKAGGKSVAELTDFCKQISEKDKTKKRRHSDSSDLSSSDSDIGRKSSDENDTLIHHPFVVKDANIVMNIRNARSLPVKTPQEKMTESATLRLTFPVSSGSVHRDKEDEWVPVEPTPAVPTPATVAAPMNIMPLVPIARRDNVFPEPSPAAQSLDISAIVSERLSAVRRLAANPNDSQAITQMHQVQRKASAWAQSKELPGQFIGSTGVKVLSQQELSGPNKNYQAWARKDQFHKAVPLQGGIGMFLLQKMGWKQGEGLGKNKEGNLEPLALDVKTDRKGLSTLHEGPQQSKARVQQLPRMKDLSGKHPVSAVTELCRKRRWLQPVFIVVSEAGPDHKKSFKFKVRVNNVEYQPAIGSANKKVAKAEAATVCLQELGLVPR